MNWFRRLPQWLSVLRIEARGGLTVRGGFQMFAKMFRAILSGPVPRSVWRRRLRTCNACPVFNHATRACRRHHNAHTLGCGCYTPFQALTAAPYPEGCWGQKTMGESLGWPAYHFASRRQKFAAVLGFIFPFLK